MQVLFLLGQKGQLYPKLYPIEDLLSAMRVFDRSPAMACLRRRGSKYYAQYYVGRRQKRISLNTTSLQIAKDKLRQLESSLHRGEEAPLPTRTKIEEILQRYADHVRIAKTPKSAQTDIYYLRQVFGPICPALQVNSRRQSVRAMKRPPKEGQDRRFKMSVIEVACLEEITTSDVSNFVHSHVSPTSRIRPRIWTFFGRESWISGAARAGGGLPTCCSADLPSWPASRSA